MKSTFFLLVFFVININLFAQQKLINIDSSNLKKLRIDPSNATGANASDVFSEVNYIPLETTKESLFGRIDQLEVTVDYFVIFDKNTNSILIFEKSGKFHAKIHGGNSNVDFKSTIRNFHVNNWRKEISFQKVGSDGTLVYDFNGKKIKEIITPSSGVAFSIYSFVGADDVIFTNKYSSSSFNAPNSDFLIYHVSGFKTITSMALPFGNVDNKKLSADMISSGTGSFFSSGIDTVLLYSKPYDYSIFKLTPNKVEKSYQIMFPQGNSLPNDFIYNSSFDGKRMAFIRKNINIIFNITNLYQLNGLLIFKISLFDTNFKNNNLIYNLQSGTLLACEHILTDKTSYFLPTFENSQGIAFCDGKYLYTASSSLELFQAKEQNDAKGIRYSEPLNKLFSAGTKQDNPVILQVKLKDNF